MSHSLANDHIPSAQDMGPDAGLIAGVPAGANNWLDLALESFERDGYCLFRNAVDPALCDEVVADYNRFLTDNADVAADHVDQLGRHLRLVNFHLASDAAMRMGATTRPLAFLDAAFAARAGIYSSLFFEYSTEQIVHRDSPFFETIPRNLYAGMWFALEDIDPRSGPLFVHAGGQLIDCEPDAATAEARQRFPDLEGDALVGAALDIYYRNIHDAANARAAPTQLPIRKGDAVVWHALAPHGGAPAVDRSLTRRSMVFHCTPEDVQVYQQSVFFLHDGKPLPPRYGYMTSHGRQVARSGGTAFQR